MKKDQEGFGALEGILIIAVVALLVLSGMYVFNRHSAPVASSGAIKQKRADAVSKLRLNFGELQKRWNYQYYSTATSDACYVGQNNWKVHQGFHNRCTYRIIRFYGYDGDFKQAAISLDSQLKKMGWSEKAGSLGGLVPVISDYYDKYYGPNAQKLSTYPNGYTISDLPTIIEGYQKDGLLFSMDYAEKGISDPKVKLTFGEIQDPIYASLDFTFENNDHQDIAKLYKDITSTHQLMFAIALNTDYFNN